MTDLALRESEFLLYTAPDGAVKVGVLFRDETAWLTQKALAALFGVGVPAINKHLKGIFESGELAEASVISILETTAADGKTYKTRFYNLDAIIAVGYRVNSYQATQFRIWATKTLSEFMLKGFVLDDERLKQGKTLFGKDYFDELLERIREIRASERRFYQKITDLYALAIDYDAHAPLTREFFATVQNKLHWAITGQTAAELIYASADATRLYMGLTTWKHAPHGKVLKSDVTVAKNYLGEAHVRELNRIVSAYLDLAENRAQRGILMKMADWATFLNSFLDLSSYPILADKGKVSALEAKLKAEGEYDVYRKRQDAEFVSDFDRVVEETKRLDSGAMTRGATKPGEASSKGRKKP
ncbi:cell filamentation protein Fic [Corallococcus sp. CA053C]|uniref:virulence RhuM family protein n=1 Tax=Corallococcus sp. CA053C TaxID=2316732 RepID=UPI000EA04E3B|nr:virulence RhuM family protein [Corallococcus sp. CA053C]RKH05559.1 cell filamentation protein Fic [Corallococcus sp. CA053C]